MARELEHKHQVALIKWTTIAGHPFNLIFAIPNGGLRNKVVAGKLKAEGVKAGIPDLMLPVARGFYHGLFLEMKAGKNDLTENQKEKMEALRKEGYLCQTAWSWDEAKNIIEEYINGYPAEL